MIKHRILDHEGEEAPAFTMKLARGHLSALTRQIHESILIEKYESVILNSKGEYNRCQLPHLTVMMGQNEMIERG